MAEADSFLRTAERTASGIVENAERLVDRVAPPAEREIIRRALDLSTPQKVRLVRRLWRDPRVRASTRLPMAAGALYLVLPIKLVPPALAPLRRWEKLIGLGLLLWLIVRITPEDVLREHLDAVEGPGMIGRIFKRE